MMNRRDFVRRLVTGLAGTAVAAELDLERLLWVPKPMIVVPALPGPAFTSIEWVTKEALRVFKNQLTFANVINRQYDLIDAKGVGDGVIQHGAYVRAEDVRDDLRYSIEPAAMALAERVKRQGDVTTFGVPEVFSLALAEECAVVVDKKSGTALRGASIYDITEDDYYLRFDVLTGGQR